MEFLGLIMKVERTHDMEVVKRIMSHPRVWPHIHEDGPTEPAPFDHEGLIWAVVLDDGPIGVFLAHQRTFVCYEMHTCLLPETWGRRASEAAQLFLTFMFCQGGCQKIVTNVPAYNRHALRFAKANGMKEEGINRASYLKDGELIDQVMLGITYKEWAQCQHTSH